MSSVNTFDFLLLGDDIVCFLIETLEDLYKSEPQIYTSYGVILDISFVFLELVVRIDIPSAFVVGVPEESYL